MLDDLLLSMTRQELRALLLECVQDCLRGSALSNLNAMPPGAAGETLVNKKEAARLLSCSQATIDNRVRRGMLPLHRIGKKAARFKLADVLALAEETARNR